MKLVRARLRDCVHRSASRLSNLGAKTTGGNLKLANGIAAVDVTIVGRTTACAAIVVTVIVRAVHRIVTVQIVNAMKTHAAVDAIRIYPGRKQRELFPAPRTD